MIVVKLVNFVFQNMSDLRQNLLKYCEVKHQNSFNINLMYNEYALEKVIKMKRKNIFQNILRCLFQNYCILLILMKDLKKYEHFF